MYPMVYKKHCSGGGREVDGRAMIASAILVPGSNPHLDTIFFANFHVTTILAISTERKPNGDDYMLYG